MGVTARPWRTQQGLSIFLDSNILTCPINAIAVAAVADIVPSPRLTRQLHESTLEEDEDVDEDEMPLLAFLQDHIDDTLTATRGVRRGPGVHAHNNRLLRRVESIQPRGANETIKKHSSHSFRRGERRQQTRQRALACSGFSTAVGGNCRT
jgi:hypothetical protein